MATLSGLARELAAIVAQDGASAPARICLACIAHLPVARAAITVMSGPDHQEPIWASDDTTRYLDQLQFSLGEGPCVEAFTDRRPVLVPDLADVTDHRWPMFAAAAANTPVRALYVLPMQVGVVAIGVLDLYRDTPGPLAAGELAGASHAADAALRTLLDSRRAAALNDNPDTPNTGDTPAADLGGDSQEWLLGSSPLRHVEVYQATGMVIAQLEVSAETALATLRG